MAKQTPLDSRGTTHRALVLRETSRRLFRRRCRLGGSCLLYCRTSGTRRDLSAGASRHRRPGMVRGIHCPARSGHLGSRWPPARRLSFDAFTGKISGTPLRSGAYPVTVRATNEGGPGECKITITVREPFDVWAAQFGHPEGEAGAVLDNDHDGASALLEYAAGTNPSSGADGTDATPFMLRDALGTSFHFQRRTGRPDLTWLVEFTANLQTWKPVVKISAANGITVLEPRYSAAQGGSDPCVIVRLAGKPAPAGFLRVVVFGDR